VALPSASPCGVKEMPRRPAASLIRLTPSQASYSARCRLTDECAMPSSRAAERTPPWA
jgi:hypothetical protein